eukprot:2726259-Amphidinium_carterae.1
MSQALTNKSKVAVLCFIKILLEGKALRTPLCKNKGGDVENSFGNAHIEAQMYVVVPECSAKPEYSSLSCAQPLCIPVESTIIPKMAQNWARFLEGTGRGFATHQSF